MALDSLIGFAVGAITDPAPGADSQIGFAVGRIRNPHHPIAVMVGGDLVHIPLATWNGTELI